MKEYNLIADREAAKILYSYLKTFSESSKHRKEDNIISLVKDFMPMAIELKDQKLIKEFQNTLKANIEILNKALIKCTLMQDEKFVEIVTQNIRVNLNLKQENLPRYFYEENVELYCFKEEKYKHIAKLKADALERHMDSKKPKTIFEFTKEIINFWQRKDISKDVKTQVLQENIARLDKITAYLEKNHQFLKETQIAEETKVQEFDDSVSAILLEEDGDIRGNNTVRYPNNRPASSSMTTDSEGSSAGTPRSLYSRSSSSSAESPSFVR